MGIELRIERLFDASPAEVFDAFVDPAAQQELHGDGTPGWTVGRCETDVRVGGTSIYEMGQDGQDPDVETRLFSIVDRPNRLEFRHSMQVPGLGTTDTDMTITFEDQGGKTLLTMVQTGFQTIKDRDDYMNGWPTYLDTLGRVVSSRVTR